MLTVFLLETLKGRDHSEEVGIDGRIILEGGSVWTGYIGVRTGIWGGSL